MDINNGRVYDRPSHTGIAKDGVDLEELREKDQAARRFRFFSSGKVEQSALRDASLNGCR